MPQIAGVAEDDLAGWLAPAPKLGRGLGALSDAVYNHSDLPLRVREIARMRIAVDNECEVCRTMRDAEGPAAGIDDDFYDHVSEWASWPGYSEAERLAAEFAERFAIDHRSLRDDEDFWTRLHAVYDDSEVLQLGISCALWLGSGRLMRVLDVAQACRIVLHE